MDEIGRTYASYISRSFYVATKLGDFDFFLTRYLLELVPLRRWFSAIETRRLRMHLESRIQKPDNRVEHQFLVRGILHNADVDLLRPGVRTGLRSWKHDHKAGPPADLQ